MKRIRLVLAVAATMVMMVAGSAGSALAVPVHQHTIDTPGQGDPAIAQGFCSGNGAQNAFDNLHFNVHKGAPGLAESNPNPVSMSGGKCQ